MRSAYPDQRGGRELLEMNSERDKVEAINQRLCLEEVVAFRHQSAEVKTSDSLLARLRRVGQILLDVLFYWPIMPVPSLLCSHTNLRSFHP